MGLRSNLKWCKRRKPSTMLGPSARPVVREAPLEDSRPEAAGPATERQLQLFKPRGPPSNMLLLLAALITAQLICDIGSLQPPAVVAAAASATGKFGPAIGVASASARPARAGVALFVVVRLRRNSPPPPTDIIRRAIVVGHPLDRSAACPLPTPASNQLANGPAGRASSA